MAARQVVRLAYDQSDGQASGWPDKEAGRQAGLYNDRQREKEIQTGRERKT